MGRGTQRLFGFHPVHEALRGRPGSVRRVWILAQRRGGRRSEIEALCAESGVVVTVAAESDPVWLGGAVHNGFAAEIDERGAVDGESRRDGTFLLLAEDVQDPRNLGALLRVCEGAGVGRVLVRDRGSAPLSDVAAKSSAGASEWLPVERIGSSAQELERLRKEGFWIYGLAAGGRAPWSLDLTGPIVICVGGEENGLRQLTRERCDALIGLPMHGQVSSLNLATAAAAVLYEAVRQRSAGKSGLSGGPSKT
ncbi:MAG: TrmH family RNA methyltransferase [Thermoanaerobaculia bacterium]